MFLSVADNLPKTSYIKMVDVWLIVTLAFPFLEVFYKRTRKLSKRNFFKRFYCIQPLITSEMMMKVKGNLIKMKQAMKNVLP